MSIFGRLIARLRHDPAPTLPLAAPELEARVGALERTVARLDELAEEATERELKWAEMNAQLRRYLGRLDAHAGRAKQSEEQQPPTYRPDVIAAKYPNGVPTKGA